MRAVILCLFGIAAYAQVGPLFPGPGMPAVTVVQPTRVGHVMGTSDNSTGTSVSVTYNATTGNALIVGHVGYRSGSSAGFTSSCADGVNTYTQDRGQQSPNAAHSQAFLYHSFAVTGGSRSITCTTNVAVFHQIFVIEYTPLIATDSFNSTGANTSAAISTGAVTTTVTNDVLIALAGDNNVTPTGFTAGGGFTTVDVSDGNISIIAIIADQIPAVSGTFTGTFTYTNNNGTQGWEGIIGAYKGA